MKIAITIHNYMSDNLNKWFALNSTPGFGNAAIKKLYDHFGSIDAIFDADFAGLSEIENLSQKGIKFFIENKSRLISLEKLIFPEGVKALALDDDEYPKNLLQINDPPPIIYKKGTIVKKDEKALAIVGTRKASHYGLSVARRLASEIASLGITIVSGMAYGIDTAAHEGALGAGGRTFAVLGCGVNVVYPPENFELAKKIIETGCLISEFSPDDPVENWKFPARNRIISGLSLGTIVIEGGYKSGAMITAKLALEQGREVFAVPGNIEFEQSKGLHWLIKQGAKLIEGIDDILDELTHVLNILPSVLGKKEQNKKEEKDYTTLSFDEHNLLKYISFEPIHIDEIIKQAEVDISKALVLLSQLEMKKFIRQLPGKLFILF